MALGFGHIADILKDANRAKASINPLIPTSSSRLEDEINQGIGSFVLAAEAKNTAKNSNDLFIWGFSAWGSQKRKVGP
jgi:hypothetical protein